MNNHPFIFLHVPKTAGTTLRAIIERQYLGRDIYTIYDDAPDHHSTSDLEELDEEARDRILVFCGHVPFGLHKRIGGALRYFTLLRDPVERVLSYYHHRMNLSPTWQGNQVSLMKFVLETRDIEVDNLQTRLLSGVSRPFGRCHEGMLWTAIDNVERHFEVVGTSEMFDESLMLMKAALGWERPFYVRENESRGRRPAEHYSRVELETVRDHNRFDALLYAYVKRRLKQQIKRAGEAFRRDLQRFREANQQAGADLTARTVWPRDQSTD